MVAYRRFLKFLKRNPDDAELGRYREGLASGASRDQLLLDLAGQSEEFLSKYRVKLGIITEDMTQETSFVQIWEKCRNYTITSMERAYAMYKAVEHVVKQEIPGDIVECGVWKGGSWMVAAYTLLLLRDTVRSIYLYDTFAGMKEPTVEDVRFDGTAAHPLWSQAREDQNRSRWWNYPLEEVRRNLLATGYPADNLVFVEGRVEETIPARVPEQIAALRLDTDWYESTLHELRHLYPRLAVGGVLIIDDYGWWTGSRKATEQYFQGNGIHVLLCRIDASGARMGVKTRP